MSVIENLEQRLDRVIKSATEHARFSGTLAEDLGAIESKVAARIEAALNSVETNLEARLAALRTELVGEFTGLSGDAADTFERTVGALPRKADPGTGQPVLG